MRAATPTFWAQHIDIGIGSASIDESLAHWVNDGLMTFFFFLISLEIKRELVTGELRHPKRAALPIIAALGGVITPIAIFLIVSGGQNAAGWGIPMATDAAFAIGVLALLGDRVGVGVKLFLVTIAVVDDVRAILVIAVAYTDHPSLGWLALAVVGLLGTIAMRALGARRILLCPDRHLRLVQGTSEPGIHATLAGVALALICPATPVAGRDVLGEPSNTASTPGSTTRSCSSRARLPTPGVKERRRVLRRGAPDRPPLAALRPPSASSSATAVPTHRRPGSPPGALPEGVDPGALGAAALGGIGFTVSFITLRLRRPPLVGAARHPRRRLGRLRRHRHHDLHRQPGHPTREDGGEP